MVGKRRGKGRRRKKERERGLSLRADGALSNVLCVG